MSVRLLTKFRKSGEDLAGLSPGARFVLHLYCDCADNSTLLAYPGTPLLMQLMGYSERQVQRYVQECRQRGFLVIVRNRGGRHHFAVYRVNLGVPVLDPNKIPPEVRADLIRRGLLTDDGSDLTPPDGEEGESEEADRTGAA
jgi:hypothetical protein